MGRPHFPTSTYRHWNVPTPPVSTQSYTSYGVWPTVWYGTRHNSNGPAASIEHNALHYTFCQSRLHSLFLHGLLQPSPSWERKHVGHGLDGYGYSRSRRAHPTPTAWLQFRKSGHVHAGEQCTGYRVQFRLPLT